MLGCFLCFCLDVCGWLTLAKLIRDRRKTRFSKGKAGTRQNNLRHIVFVNVIYNSRGVYLQQNKSWQALPSTLHCLCQPGYLLPADGHTMSNAPDLF